MRPSLPTRAACLALILAALPAHAGTMTARATRGDSLVLLADLGTAAVQVADARTLTLSVPPNTQLESLTGTTASWVATGTRPLQTRAVRKGSDIVVVVGDSSESRVLPRVPGRRGRERAEPLALLEHDQLTGLVWLEGEARNAYAVRSAAWNGERWEAPQTIAERAPGSQLALSTAVLADGSWLAVWSRFDGEDDELYWSRHTASGWSPAARLNAKNHVPDITPSLVASSDGALVAWSQFDGSDFRLRVARFDGHAWQEPVTVGGPGWLYPETAAGESGDTVVRVRQAYPRQWAWIELDTQARLRRIASASDRGEGTPLLRGSAESGVRVRWTTSGAESTLPWRPLP
ncbi:MAG: hypothetical protein ABI609_14750 [Acidobacteriota bacterium]